MPTINELSLEEIQAILAALEQAIRDHSQWLMSWHRSLICQIMPEEREMAVDAYRQCRFGQWYYQGAHPVLKTLPEFQRMELVHATMHATAQSLLLKSMQEDKLSIEEYDSFLTFRGEFREMVHQLETVLVGSIHHTDPLTRVMNRQVLAPQMRTVWEKVRRGEPCVLCMADIDYFKSVNDTHGHLAGDKVLSDMASFLVHHLRPSELVFRYGGEEFLICLPDTTLSTSLKVMDRIRESLSEHQVAIGEETFLTITCSFGLAAIQPMAELEEVIHWADKALYAAKRSGRNRVVAWTGPDSFMLPTGMPVPWPQTEGEHGS